MIIIITNDNNHNHNNSNDNDVFVPNTVKANSFPDNLGNKREGEGKEERSISVRD